MILADDTQRTSIVGRTGSGKTVAAAHHLSKADFTVKPWIVYDFKHDGLLTAIAGLKGAEHIGLDTVPRRPGLYFVHPLPHEVEAVQAQMWRIWSQENTGVYCDEGYMAAPPPGVNPAFRALLTQGRSKHIPMIVLSQRPVWLDKFVFSEADFFQVFALSHIGDRKKVMEYVPADLTRRLPPYYSYYHAVNNPETGEPETLVLKPVPEPDVILEHIETRLLSMRKKHRTVVV